MTLIINFFMIVILVILVILGIRFLCLVELEIARSEKVYLHSVIYLQEPGAEADRNLFHRNDQSIPIYRVLWTEHNKWSGVLIRTITL